MNTLHGARNEPVVRRILAERSSFLAFVRGRVSAEADAEDLFQQALIRASDHAEALRDPSQLRAWFFKILRRTVADHRARSAMRESKLAALADTLEEATPEEVAVCGCSLSLLDRLKPEYADVLRRIDLEDEPIADAALASGVTVNNLGVRLHRARRALREEIRTFCGVATLKACLSCDCDH